MKKIIFLTLFLITGYLTRAQNINFASIDSVNVKIVENYQEKLIAKGFTVPKIFLESQVNDLYLYTVGVSDEKANPPVYFTMVLAIKEHHLQYFSLSNFYTKSNQSWIALRPEEHYEMINNYYFGMKLIANN